MRFKNKTTKLKHQMILIFIGQYALTWIPLVIIGADMSMFSDVQWLATKLNKSAGSGINFYNFIGMGSF